MKVNHYLKEKMLEFIFTEEIDHHNCSKMRDRIDYEIQRITPKKAVFDFQNVSFMDSAGIGLVIGRYKTLLNYGGELEIINVNKKIYRVFEMSGLLQIISVKTLENKKQIV